MATVATLGAAVAAPAPAEARRLGPDLAFGLAAGAIGTGLLASTYPGYAYGPGYYYGPGYGYYGPRYYRPAYYGGPYAYYGGPAPIATATGATVITGKHPS